MNKKTDRTEITQPRDGLYICTRRSLQRKYETIDNKPCDEAFQIIIESTVLNKKIIFPVWAVENINLKDFLKKYGECVLWVDSDGYFNIEIYDDYRE